MARATINDIVTLVRRECGQPQLRELPLNDILRMANDELGIMAAVHRFPQLVQDMTVPTVSGTAAYNFTRTDVQRVMRGHVVSPWQRVSPMNREAYERKGTASGVPLRFLLGYSSGGAANTVTFWPTPNGIYSVVLPCHVRHPELMFDDEAQTLILSEEWDLVLRERLTVRCLCRLEKWEAAQNFFRTMSPYAREGMMEPKLKPLSWDRVNSPSRPGQAVSG